jgi:hypothetical protein
LKAAFNDPAEQQIILKRFLEELYSHVEGSLEDYAKASAVAKGGSLAYDDWDGGYSDALKQFKRR